MTDKKRINWLPATTTRLELGFLLFAIAASFSDAFAIRTIQPSTLRSEASSSFQLHSTYSGAWGFQNATEGSDDSIYKYAKEPRIQLPLSSLSPFPTDDVPSTTMQRQQRRKKRKSASSSRTSNKKRDFTIYCDLDGVLVDFEHGVRQVFPDVPCPKDKRFPIETLKKREMLWDRIQESESFFEQLPWTEGGKEVWTALLKTEKPVNILTGVPVYTESRVEKFRWCERELQVPVKHVDMAGPARLHVPGIYFEKDEIENNQQFVEEQLDLFDKKSVCNVITCWSEKKHHESKPGAVLIDDRLDLKESWEAKGGIFIHHKTGDAVNTVLQLIEHGILEADKVDLKQLKKQSKNKNTVSPRDEEMYRW